MAAGQMILEQLRCFFVCLCLLVQASALSTPSRCWSELESFSVPSTAGYFTHVVQVAFPQYNIPCHLPPFVVTPRNTLEVQAAMRCAKKEKALVSLKGGGHSYAGFSQGSPHGFQLSLQRYMNSMHFTMYNDTPALVVEGGAVFAQVLAFLDERHPDYVLAGGFCPSVGVAGFHLGGGLGALCREFGMGVDNVLEVEVVLNNGTLLPAVNAKEHSDLFWALRGGGGPSFGVVTKFTVRLHLAPKRFVFGELSAGSTKSEIVENLMLLAKYTKTSDFPEWLTVDWRLINRTDTPRISGCVGLCYLIYSSRDITQTIAALRPILTWRTRWTIGPMVFRTFSELESINAGVKGYERVFEYPIYNKNCILPNLDFALIVSLANLWETIPTPPNGPSCYIQGMALGGPVISSVPADATAFPWRNRVLYAADSECGEYFDEASETAAKSFVDRYIEAVKPFCLGAYLNFPYTDNNPHYATGYWEVNLPRLVEVRSKYNSCSDFNPLTFSQEVPCSYPLSR